jgi:hypothetical protein
LNTLSLGKEFPITLPLGKEFPITLEGLANLEFNVL